MHSKISISAYYLSKIFRVLLNFMVAIIVTFCVGAFVRDVELPLSGWLGSGALLLLSSLVFLAFGLLIARLNPNKSCLWLQISPTLAWLLWEVHGCLFPCFQSGFRAFLSGRLSIVSMSWLLILLSMGNFHGNSLVYFGLYCSSNRARTLYQVAKRK